MTVRSLFFLVFCLGSCSTTSTGQQTPEAQACLDMADVVASAAERCGQDYRANYDGFVQAAAKGSCANIIKVRDEAALRHTCLPSLETAPCSDLLAGRIDSSCSAQLIHQSLEPR